MSEKKFQLHDYEIPIGDTYILDGRKKFDSGSYSDLYYGKDIKRDEKVMIKLEPIDANKKFLLYESKLYTIFQGGMGIPKLRWYGSQGNYNILVMDSVSQS